MSLTSVEIPLAETPQEDQAHIDAMVAKAESLNEPQATGDNKTEETLLAGKYKTLEDLEKGYKELEKMLGQRNQQKDSTPPTETKSEDDVQKDTENEQNVDNKDEQKNTDNTKTDNSDGELDLTPFEEEFAQSGELSSESYAALAKKGIPKGVVDNYIAGVQALAESKAQSVYNSVGGEQEYRQMIEWAKSNLSSDEVKAFNNTVISSDTAQALLAVKGLNAQYQAKRGKTPRLIDGTEHSSINSSDSFNSVAEVTAAMKDPRYQKDPTYRKEVETKLMRSNIL